jgi:hypothetical protein
MAATTKSLADQYDEIKELTAKVAATEGGKAFLAENGLKINEDWPEGTNLDNMK